MHLAVEDEKLFPALAAAGDEQLRSLTQECRTESGGLREATRMRRRKWPSVDTIQDSPDDFVLETKRLLSGLKRRIAREEHVLLSMAERVGSC